MTCNQPHEWQWVATYADGTVLRECPGDGGPHRAKKHLEIDRVVEIAWEPESSLVGTRVAVQKPDRPGAMLTFARRNRIMLNMDTGEVSRPKPILVLGWETPNDQEYTFVLDDGTTRVSKELNAV